MTIAGFELQDGDKYLVKVGNGYFVRFNGKNPYAVSTPILASVFNYYEAIGILIDLEKNGFQGELVIEPGVR